MIPISLLVGKFLCFLEAFVLYLETWGGAMGGGVPGRGWKMLVTLGKEV